MSGAAAPAVGPELATYRQHLLGLMPRSAPGVFLDAAFPYLAAVVDDDAVASAALERLLELGLGALAREVLQGVRLAEPVRRAFVERMRRVPAGRVPWPERRAVFEANCAVLRRHAVVALPGPREFDAAVRRLHLFRTVGGQWAVARKQAGHPREWLTSLAAPQIEAALELPDLSSASCLFADGVSAGGLLERLYAACAETGIDRSVPLCVVEPDIGRLAAWLHVADHRDLLASPRVVVACGAGCHDALRDYMLQQEDLWVTAALAVCPPGHPNHAEQLIGLSKAVEAGYAARVTALKAQVAERHAQHTSRHWTARLQGRLRVLGLTSRHTTVLQYSTRDIGTALEGLGHEFRMLMEPAPHRRLGSARVARELLEYDPDLIVMVNHLRYEYGDLLGDVPVLTWLQDPMPNLLCAEAGARQGPLDFCCGYFRQECVEQFGYARERFINAVVPVSSDCFHPGPIGDDADVRCDVMYAGHLSETPASLMARWREQNAPELHAVLSDLDGAVRDRMARGEHLMTEPVELVDAVCAQRGIQLGDAQRHRLANFFAYALFDLLFRWQTLQWVAEWSRRTGRHFRIYGNGWEGHPQFAPFACGPVEHGEALRRAYRGAGLVLQTVPTGFRHQRTLEALLSGSLVLARFSPRDYGGVAPEEFPAFRAAHPQTAASARYFKAIDAVLFRNADDFAARAEHFLTDAVDRARVAADLAADVHAAFTYRRQVQTVLDDLVQRLPPDGAAASGSPSGTGST